MKAILVLIFTLVCCAAGTNTNHSVGGASGWDLFSDLQKWATNNTLSVGDSLVFRTTPVHNVLEVRKRDYDSCETLYPLETHDDVETVIPLRQAGNRYFICGWLGHCDVGLKLHVLVLPAVQMSPSVNAMSPSTLINNSNRHGPDNQEMGQPLPTSSNYSINSRDSAPLDSAKLFVIGTAMFIFIVGTVAVLITLVHGRLKAGNPSVREGVEDLELLPFISQWSPRVSFDFRESTIEAGADEQDDEPQVDIENLKEEAEDQYEQVRLKEALRKRTSREQPKKLAPKKRRMM